MPSDTKPNESINQDRLTLRLFVGGASPRSLRAIAAVRRICEAARAGRYDLEVIDIFLNPEATLRDQIVAVPTLLRMAPEPKRWLVGDMSETSSLAANLGLAYG